MRHIIPISGKDSLATALAQMARQPDLPYEYVFNPTGAELPEVFEWIDRVSKHLGKPIIQVGRNLEAIIKEYNYFLPSGQARYCTRKSKIEPFEEWINKELCTVYFGIRADEDRGGYDNSKTPWINIVYTLKEMSIGLKNVYQIINHAGLKPPTFFWEWMYEEVKRIVGFDPKMIMPEHLFDMLFAWRSRANCFFCFSQRVYELCGLLEHHPDLFDKMEWYEDQGGYHWREGYPCSLIRKRFKYYRRKRARAIAKVVFKLQQMTLFDLEDLDEKGFVDFLAITSCGLMCGK